jgi:hypothetical protein
MSEPLEPMSTRLKALLKEGADVGPPPGTAARVFSQLQGAMSAPMAAPAPAPAAPLPAAPTGLVWGTRWLASGLIIGAIGGTVAGRTFFERVEVRVVERVVEVPAPAPVAAPIPAPLPVAPIEEAAPKPKEPRKAPAATDASLAQERSLLETARSALVRGDAAQALDSLNAHQRQFAEGRLIEERESLAIQALLRLGQKDAARTRAEKFHQRWPDSLFGPVVDAAFQ